MIELSILAVGMELRTMLAYCEEDLENTVTHIFDSVHKFYVLLSTRW